MFCLIVDWLVALALAPDDEKETKHLRALDGADTCLKLFQIDLLNYDSILAAVNGTVGVFHLASPCIVDKVHDPEVLLFLSWSPSDFNTIAMYSYTGAGFDWGFSRSIYNVECSNILQNQLLDLSLIHI